MARQWASSRDLKLHGDKNGGTRYIYPVQLKLGFIREQHTSPVCQWPSKGEHLPTDAELPSGQDPGEDDEHADELP